MQEEKAIRLVSVVIPVYNEEESLAELVRRTGIEFLPGAALQTSGKLQQASAPAMQRH